MHDYTDEMSAERSVRNGPAGYCQQAHATATLFGALLGSVQLQVGTGTAGFKIGSMNLPHPRKASGKYEDFSKLMAKASRVVTKPLGIHVRSV